MPLDMNTNLQTFIRFTEDRSQSNLKAIEALCDLQLYGQAVSILRQELDSLTRVCYLIATTDPVERQKLVDDKVSGTKWSIGDGQLVQRAKLYNSWATDVYFFGNNFTHLTDFHDYKVNDPLLKLSSDEKEQLRYYLHSYHQFPTDRELSFDNVVPYIQKVANKVANNLKSYLRHLQAL
jgi:hypothetical protein